MRLIPFLLVCSMIASVAVGQDTATTTSSAPPEPLETEIFRLGTTGIGTIRSQLPLTKEEGAAETIQDFLLQSDVPWPEGSNITYDHETGTLVVTNTPTNMVLVRELVRLWDTPAIQVEIEARFVEILHTFFFENSFEAEISPLLLPSRERKPWPEGGPCEPRTADSDQMLSIYGIMTRPDFEFIWHALDQKDWSDLLSAPRVTIISGQRAVVEVTQKEEPLRITLDVTPIVSADGKMITLVLTPEVALLDKEADERAEAGASRVAVSVTTTVHLRDGETVVLGGLMPDRTAKEAGDKSSLLILVTVRFICPASRSHCASRQEGP